MTSPETLELEAIDAALAGRWVAPEHDELAELALLLRDDRPEPTPAFVNRLDRRLQTGFPARPRPRRQWIRNAFPVLAVTAIVAAIAVPIGLSIDSSGGGDDASSGATETGAGGGSAGGSGDSAAGTSQAAPATRREAAPS